MKIVRVKDYQEMSRKGADFVLGAIKSDRRANLALATGGTPELMYGLLAKNFPSSDYQGHVFNLDEYLGFSEKDEVSNRNWLRQKFLKYAGIPEERIHLIDGKCENPVKYCGSYERLISENGGIGLAILGIGPDGHVANVMPSGDRSLFKTRTGVVSLPPSFMEYHASDLAKLKSPPTHSMTVGMGTMTDAKIVLMMASGKKKAQAVKDMIEGDISPLAPASILRTHKNCVYIIDEGAASLLKVGV